MRLERFFLRQTVITILATRMLMRKLRQHGIYDSEGVFINTLVGGEAAKKGLTPEKGGLKNF
jgi:hypothetical protein